MATFFDALVLKLGGDPTELKKALDDADKALGKFKSSADKTASAGKSALGALGKAFKALSIGVGALATTATAAAGTVLALAKSSAKQADEAGKAAQKTGTQAQEYQRLAYAAKTADVEQEAFNKGLNQLNKNMVAAKDPASAMGKEFAALGVKVTDASGNMRSTGDVVLDLADKFAGMPNGAEKSAAAMMLMGRAGADMIPFLNEGGVRIKALGDEAQHLGLVFSDQAIAQSDKFNDSLDAMLGAFAGIKNMIGQIFIPQLTELFQNITAWVTQNRQLIVQWVQQGWDMAVQIVKDLFNLFTGNDGAVVNQWLIQARDGMIDFKNAAVATLDVLQALIAPFKFIYDTSAAVTAMLGGVSSADRRGAGLAFADGGIVRGPGSGTSDSITARLSNGEGVIRARAVDHYGQGLVHAINSLRLPKFAEGGIVGAAGGGRPVNVHFGGESFALAGAQSEVGRLMRAGRLQLALRPRWAGR